jgi:hypothetical protein
MRLINTRTYILEECFGDDTPPYAILSHTWGREEVDLQEWLNPTVHTASKEGHKKLLSACALALGHGHNHIWVDTNCIDKTSSAELSEAINCMFDWYERSKVCYVFLEDISEYDVLLREDDIGKARWFTRGWTLQELLAPATVEFYSQEWVKIGTKETLAKSLSEITKIDFAHLSGPFGSRKFRERSNIAEKMSWVSNRSTTRVEDMAYCMLGIFNINMPLLYGEGSKAFIRLQEEIMKTSADHSLFCWNVEEDRSQAKGDSHETVGFLAPSAKAFKSTRVEALLPGGTPLSPYMSTNIGISIRFPVLQTLKGYILILHVGKRNPGSAVLVPLGIVCEHENAQERRCRRRAHPKRPIPLSWQCPPKGQPLDLFMISQSPIDGIWPFESRLFDPDTDHSGPCLLLTFGNQRVQSVKTWPEDLFDHERSILKSPHIDLPTDLCFEHYALGSQQLATRSVVVQFKCHGQQELAIAIAITWTFMTPTSNYNSSDLAFIDFDYVVIQDEDWIVPSIAYDVSNDKKREQFFAPLRRRIQAHAEARWKNGLWEMLKLRDAADSMLYFGRDSFKYHPYKDVQHAHVELTGLHACQTNAVQEIGARLERELNRRLEEIVDISIDSQTDSLPEKPIPRASEVAMEKWRFIEAMQGVEEGDKDRQGTPEEDLSDQYDLDAFLSYS